MNDFMLSVRLEGGRSLRVERMPSITDGKQFCVYIIDETAPENEVEIVGSVESISQALWLFDRRLFASKAPPPSEE